MRAAATKSTRGTSHDPLSIYAYTELDPHVALAVVTFLCRLGWSDFYYDQVLPGFTRRPALIVLAASADPAHEPPMRDTVQGLLYVEPVDGRTATLSRTFLAPAHTSSIGLVAALHKVALEHLAHYGLRAQLLLAEGNTLTPAALTRVGFARRDELTGYRGVRFARFEADAKTALGKLGLDRLHTDTLIGPEFGPDTLDPTVQLVAALLLLAGLERPPGAVTDIHASEPGYPPEPSPPTPSPGPDGGSEPGTSRRGHRLE